jgi:hypothetical protein
VLTNLTLQYYSFCRCKYGRRSWYAGRCTCSPNCVLITIILLILQVQIREAVLVRGPFALVLLTLGHELVQ